MSEEKLVLDIIKTEERIYKGVVDSVSTKFYTFYDFSTNENPDISTMLIIWRLYYNHMRFSLFKRLYFGHYTIADPIQIPKKSIQEKYIYEEPIRVRKKVSKITKLSHPDCFSD